MVNSVIHLIIQFLLHLNTELPVIINSIGGWTYLVLFVLIFIETGLVVMPFLPGDSLLFTTGAILALPGTLLHIWFVYPVVAIAAVLGDTSNYWIGDYIGPKVFSAHYRWIKHEYLIQTQNFFEKHGGKTIFLARFVPIIRTFAPFVAGVGSMSYKHFISFNLLGGVVWTALLLGFGYFFGNIPLVRDHFSLFLLVLIVLSTIPAIYEGIKARREQRFSEMNSTQ